MKKIKIVLAGVILVVGFFFFGERAWAGDPCVDKVTGVKGTCDITCDGWFGYTKLNADCGLIRNCCTATSNVEAAAKAQIEKDVLDKKAKEIASAVPGCCIKTLNTSDPDFGKSTNCYDIDMNNTTDMNNCLGLMGKSGNPEKGACKANFYQQCGLAPLYGDNSGATGNNTPIAFDNPIGIDSVSGLLDSILNNMMGLIIIIAVIFIIIGGIMYMTSAGNEKMVTRAKQTWTGATVGLAIALASPTFLKQIKEILNSNSTTGGTADNWVNKALTIKEIAMNVLSFLLSVFGVLAIIALVIGGGMYLTAYGDEKKIDSGKSIITYALIGIVVALSALVLTRQIASLIGVTP